MIQLNNYELNLDDLDTVAGGLFNNGPLGDQGSGFGGGSGSDSVKHSNPLRRTQVSTELDTKY